MEMEMGKEDYIPEHLYTSKDVQDAVNRRFKILTESKVPSKNPSIVFLGGLPGSGKGSASDAIEIAFQNRGGIIISNINDFRQFHPHAPLIAEKGRRLRGINPDY